MKRRKFRTIAILALSVVLVGLPAKAQQEFPVVARTLKNGQAPGPFASRSFTKNQTAAALDLTLKVLDNLDKNGVTDEQLASAKSYIKGQFPPSIETSAQLAQIIVVHEFYGLGDDEVNELEARVDAVKPEIARLVIQKHFPTADDLVFVLRATAPR